MMRYSYNITGEYNDWGEIKAGDFVLHNGSIISMIKIIDNKVLIALNYGCNDEYIYEIKKKDEWVVGVPLINNKYEEHNIPTEKKYYEHMHRKYFPLTFSKAEYAELIRICYIDKKYAYCLEECNQKDLVKMWIKTYDLNYFSNIEEYLNDIFFKNILCFSNDKITAIKFKQSLTNDPTILEQYVSNNDLKIVTIFLNYETIEEWEALVIIGSTLYLRLTNDIGIKLNYNITNVQEIESINTKEKSYAYQ